MKKSLIAIGILLFFEIYCVYSFYHRVILGNLRIPDFERNAMRKSDVALFLIILIITYLLINEVVGLYRKRRKSGSKM